MMTRLHLVLATLASLFQSRTRLQAENAALRQQLAVLRQEGPGRVYLTSWDRFVLVWPYRLFPSILSTIQIVQPETVIRWHRGGFRAYWRWRSRSAGGRPRIDAEIRSLIRQMSGENPLWGTPRIHGEMLKLGFEIAQSTVAKYMIRGRRPPSQTWKTFLKNHAT